MQNLPFISSNITHLITILQQYDSVHNLIERRAKEVYKETFPNSVPSNQSPYQSFSPSCGQFSGPILEDSQFNPDQVSDSVPPLPTSYQYSTTMGHQPVQNSAARVSNQTYNLLSSDYSNQSDQYVSGRGIKQSSQGIYNLPQNSYERFFPQEMPSFLAVSEPTTDQYEEFLPLKKTSLNHNQYEDFLPGEIHALPEPTSQTFEEEEIEPTPQSVEAVSPKGYEDFLPTETQPAPFSAAVSPYGYEEFLPGAGSRNHNMQNKHSRGLSSDSSQITSLYSNRTASVQHYNSRIPAPYSKSKSNGNDKSGREQKHIHDIDTGERISISSLLQSSGSQDSEAEWKRYNSLYLADLESRGRADTRRSSVKMLQYIKTFQALQDDDDEDDVFEGRVDEVVSNFTDCLDRNSISSFSMASLSNSLRMSIDLNADTRSSKRRYSKMSTVSRQSILMSLVLRQSALGFDKFDEDEDDDSDIQQNEVNTQHTRRKMGSIKTEARYVPDVFGSKVDRRRDSIVESATQLLATVYGQEALDASMKEPGRRKSLLDSFLALSVDDCMLNIAGEEPFGL